MPLKWKMREKYEEKVYTENVNINLKNFEKSGKIKSIEKKLSFR